MSREEKLLHSAQLENIGVDLAATASGRFLYPRLDLETRLLQLVASPGLIPVIIGAPGTGKTALAARLAVAIGSGAAHAPSALHGHRIIMTDPMTILTEAIYAQQIETKMSNLIRNVLKGKAILFLDEVEAFAGAGSSSNHQDGDVLTLLLPHIKQLPGFRVLGATTPGGWARLGQLRPAFAHRCVPVHVEPMSDDDVNWVMRGHAAHIATATGLTVEDAALDTALELATALRPGGKPPGGACDILQTAAAFQLARFERDADAICISADVVIDSVEANTGLPRFLLSRADALPHAEIRTFLSGRVIGQEAAVGSIADQINLIQHGLCAPGRPLGVFLLTGPTGVGKTELAKSVAALLHGSSSAVVRFDMSEYNTSDSVARFVGTRTGQLQTGPGLVEAAAGPYPVILLDEIEKCHPAVFDVLLQAFGEARLTDGSGRTAAFDTAIFLMTSNLGAGARPIGFTQSSGTDGTPEGMPRAVRGHFRPEFLNRLTAVMGFDPLPRAIVAEIGRREVRALAQRPGLQRRRLAVTVTEAALEALVAAGYSAEFGARPMQRVVDRQVGLALALHLEAHPNLADAEVRVDYAPDTGFCALPVEAPALLRTPVGSRGREYGAPGQKAVLSVVRKPSVDRTETRKRGSSC